MSQERAFLRHFFQNSKSYTRVSRPTAKSLLPGYEPSLPQPLDFLQQANSCGLFSGVLTNFRSSHCPPANPEALCRLRVNPQASRLAGGAPTPTLGALFVGPCTAQSVSWRPSLLMPPNHTGSCSGDIFRASTTHCSFLNGGRRKWKEFLVSLQETVKLHVALQQQPACKPTLALLLIFPPITAGH